MQVSANTPCICKNCGCKDACEFYDYAIRPVLDITEYAHHDGSDPTAIAYVKDLMTVLNSFNCEYKE